MKFSPKIAFLALILALISAFGCSSCAYINQVPKSSVYTQQNATYRILVTCPNGDRYVGTGFAVSSRHIITAFHVVDCDGLEPSAITVNKAWSTDNIAMEVDKKLKAFGPPIPQDFNLINLLEYYAGRGDAVRLVVSGTSEPFDDIVFINPRIPNVGETVCHIGSDGNGTQGMRYCGAVSYADENIIIVAGDAAGGNSGGPVFDENGYVIAILNWGSLSGNRWYAGVSAKRVIDLVPPVSPNMNPDSEWP